MAFEAPFWSQTSPNMGSASFLFKDNEYGGGQKIKALSEVTVATEGEA